MHNTNSPPRPSQFAASSSIVAFLMAALLIPAAGCGQAKFEQRLNMAKANVMGQLTDAGLSEQEKAELEQRRKTEAEARQRNLQQMRERAKAQQAAQAAGSAAGGMTPAGAAILAPPDAVGS